MKTIIYYLGLAALFTHELDAVLNMEWRLLFHLRTLPDPASSTIFIALHLPLFLVFFYFGHHKTLKIREGFRLIIAFFLVIHSGLHFNLSSHELYQFNSIISNVYIYGAALCGVAFIILSWIHSRGSDA